ncbi:MAG: glucodextranase DOMON-like domain-containing protein [Bacillota bacterium]
MAFENIKNTKLKLIIFFIICLFLLTSAVKADDYKVIFNHLDGVGDDYGPGDYYYPQNHIFQNRGNLFDLKSLTIFENEKEYKYRFSFSNLTDPWGAKYEFSLPLIEVYIDNQAGGSNKLFHSGANISFEDDFYWNKFLKISGWWVKLFNPDSRKENILNINDLSLAEPDSSENIYLNKVDNYIFLIIPKSEMNLAQNSKIIVLIGSFDPFGYDHFRSISNNKSYWQIYSESNISDSTNPRVLDILVPGGENQKEILRGEMPKIPYLKIDFEKEEGEPTLVDYLMPVNKISLSILLLYIVILIFTILKFKYKK